MHTPEDTSHPLYSARQSPTHNMALHSAVAAAQSVRSSAPPSRRGASSDTSSSSETSGILAHRLVFRPPKLGRTKLVQVTSETSRGTWSIPALCYQSPEGQVLIYPFTRMQLGKVLIVDVDIPAIEVQNIRTSALFEYCARRSDLPKEMVEKFAHDTGTQWWRTSFGPNPACRMETATVRPTRGRKRWSSLPSLPPGQSCETR